MKKIFLLSTLFFILIWSVTALEITINSNDEGGNYTDKYTFNTLWNTNIYLVLADKLSEYYEQWNRIDIFQVYDEMNNWHNSYSSVWTWVLVSELYWSFYLKDWPINFKNDQIVNSSCDTVSYSYNWSLYSPSFWKLNIQSGSYFCPLSWKSSIILKSDLLWEINISWENIINTEQILNARWEEKTVSDTTIYDDKKISVSWITNLENTEVLESDFSQKQSIDIETQWMLTNVNKLINKNLVKYTNWLDPSIDNYSNLNWFSKKIHYYNFEWQEELSSSNKDNKWKILTIWDWWEWSSYYKMWVAWQKLLYVKWWNIYINSDIYNIEDDNQLVIVVKRDSNNKKNGWNIYINPEVTNIDAILIADGSIISYDWTNILNTDTYQNKLRKQLLIYWSIYTKNTYWEDKTIYGTDHYISNWWKEEIDINTYNLAKLRSFQVELNNDIEWSCALIWDNSGIVARNNDDNIALTYAFAWKKECYLTDSPQDYLRWTEKISSLVIEYNPVIQRNPHFILRK